MALSERVSIPVRGATLAATLDVPAVTPCAAVVVAHGASEPERHAPLYEHLAEVVTEAGTACLRYDRRGEGRSTGVVDGLTLDDLAGDLLSAAGLVRGDPRIDRARVVVWGHSQGAWLAAMAAARDPSLAGVVAVSGSGTGPEKQMAHAVARVMREAGHDDPQVTRALEARRTVADWTRGTVSREVASRVVTDVANQPWAGLAFLPDRIEPDQRATRRAWIDFDPVPVLRQVRQPVLLVHGARDRWVDVPSSRAVWTTELGSRDVTSVLLPECGHSPTVATDPRDWDEAGPVSPAYTRALRAWLLRVLRR